MSPQTLDVRERLIVAPDERRRAVLDLIRSARRQIVLSIFRCDDDAVLGTLRDAAKRGVRVRAIVTGRAKGSARDLEGVHWYLLRHGVEVRRYPDVVKYHAKYIVADEATALVTTLNLTSKCFERTCDFVVVSKDAAVVSGVGELFAADWAGRRVALDSVQKDRLIVGPDDRPRERFAALIRSARHRVRLLDAKLDDPRTLALLEARSRAGVEVDIKGRDDLGTLEAHGKLLIVDHRDHRDHRDQRAQRDQCDPADDRQSDTAPIAVVGSIALSATSLDARRELAIVVRDAVALRQLDRLWRSFRCPTVQSTKLRCLQELRA